MPYKDRLKQRAYQLARNKARRAAWLELNGPCAVCGLAESLEVDHVDPSQKVSHRIWSWSEARMIAELLKCQVLCSGCHKKKTCVQLRKPLHHGTKRGYVMFGCRCSECVWAEGRGTSRIRDICKECGVSRLDKKFINGRNLCCDCRNARQRRYYATPAGE